MPAYAASSRATRRAATVLINGDVAGQPTREGPSRSAGVQRLGKLKAGKNVIDCA
jgi:hypothetical protein